MTTKEIREFAKGKNIILPKKAKKAELIRYIQKSEGNCECYSTKKCDNISCCWYKDCAKSLKNERTMEY